ncbi:MAG TPA: sugar phosphate nucleotidyltransferase [Candidatus Methylacidiphilales bacterium]|nr:sugar phosphate nucleotidyltransferase [Candidatus Methylacidiphilales bacterium]
MNFYACIMAGGSGERFWPFSRTATPKHLVPLLSKRTLLEETVRRVKRALPASHIFVLTNQAQIKTCRAAAPQLKPDQFIAEPAKRDTAPACALGTALVRSLDPNAVVVFLPADALIKDAAVFAAQLRKASALAAKGGTIVTFGIRPGHASTRFGYLETGQRLPESSAECPLFHVKRFVEKPDAARAKTYLESGRFFWNAGIFLWRTETFLHEARRLKPELAAFIEAFPKKGRDAYLKKNFPQLPKISVDYAIMEKAAQVAVAEARFDWDDVGSWTALPAHLPKDAFGNTARGAVVTHDSHDNIAVAKKRLIALCGVRDLIVIETDDAILVCHRDAAEQVKHLQPNLPEQVR